MLLPRQMLVHLSTAAHCTFVHPAPALSQMCLYMTRADSRLSSTTSWLPAHVAGLCDAESQVWTRRRRRRLRHNDCDWPRSGRVHVVQEYRGESTQPTPVSSLHLSLQYDRPLWTRLGSGLARTQWHLAISCNPVCSSVLSDISAAPSTRHDVVSYCSVCCASIRRCGRSCARPQR